MVAILQMLGHLPQSEIDIRPFTFGDAGWIAKRLGSIICTGSDDPNVAKLRMFYVEPDARGCGLGKRLLSDCLTFARQAGYKHMTLTTQESQTLGRAMYARAGFTRTSSRPDHLFGRDVVDEFWDIDL